MRFWLPCKNFLSFSKNNYRFVGKLFCADNFLSESRIYNFIIFWSVEFLLRDQLWVWLQLLSKLLFCWVFYVHLNIFLIMLGPRRAWLWCGKNSFWWTHWEFCSPPVFCFPMFSPYQGSSYLLFHWMCLWNQLLFLHLQTPL